MNRIKQSFVNFGYASHIIFTASKKYYIMKLVLSFISAFIPYLPLFLWRGLINALTVSISEDSKPILTTIWVFALCYAAAILFEKLIVSISDLISFKYNDEIQYYLDNLMVDKTASVDLSFFDSSDLKDTLNNSWSLIFSIKKMVSFIFDIIQKSIRVVISFSLMLTLSYWLIFVIILLCIPSIIGDRKVNTLDYNLRKEHTKSRRKLEYFKDLFSEGAKEEVRLYNLSDWFSSLYNDVWSRWNNAVHAKNLRVCLINIATLIVLTINEVIVYIISVLKLRAGEIAVGDVAYYVSLLTRFRSDLLSLFRRINRFNKQSKEINDVRSFIEMKPLLEKSGTKIPGSRPKIEFKSVFFKYPNAEEYVLKNRSFTIEAGQTVGLVGLNGSGKSTIVKLLCRFYDPTEGQILVDGIDSREYDIVALRKCFGVLFQDFVHYSFSLRENVALSDISAVNDDERIKKACRKGKVNEFTEDWENGVDESLTRRFDPSGRELSGGQWQRISLARTFFRDAPIVLLDEPSASLDPIAEHEIFSDFAEVSECKSAVLISHRLSSITLVDKILVLSDGRIAEEGKHEELLKINGEYARLFNLQASKYE